jgi:hypothetical protein
MNRLADAELAEGKLNFAKAKASLACEGIYLTEAEETLFREFDDERLPPDEVRRRALSFCRSQRAAKAHAAE